MSIYHPGKCSFNTCRYPYNQQPLTCGGCIYYQHSYTEYTDEEQQEINEGNYLLLMTAIAIIVLFIILAFPMEGTYISYIIIQKGNLIFKEKLLNIMLKTTNILPFHIIEIITISGIFLLELFILYMTTFKTIRGYISLLFFSALSYIIPLIITTTYTTTILHINKPTYAILSYTYIIATILLIKQIISLIVYKKNYE